MEMIPDCLVHRTAMILNGKTRSARMGGRDYIVAHVRMIVPGVMNGSKGPLYYPPDEVVKNVGIWNHVPMVVYHPQVNGEDVSARTPEILDKSQCGYVFNDHVDESGARCGEGWFDVQQVNKIDQTLPHAVRIMPRLKTNQAIELSTGLFTTNEPVENGKTPDGKDYTAVARNYVPDHLAILPDQTGACSINDGCGVLVNSEKDTTPRGIPEMNKAQLVKFLTTNCSCWKGQDAVLNAMDEPTLVKFRAQHLLALAAKVGIVGNRKAVKNADPETEETASSVDIAALAEFLGVTIDPAKDPLGFVKDMKTKVGSVLDALGGADAPETPTDTPADPAMNTPDDPEKKKEEMATNRKPLTMKEWLAGMPADAQPVWNSMVASADSERQGMIERIITVNGIGDAHKQALRGVYSKMPREQLIVIVNALPAQKTPDNGPRIPSYFGAQGIGQIAANADGWDENDILVSPTTVERKSA